MTPTANDWVLPEWRALSERPLVLGLPFGVAGLLLVVVGFVGAVLQLVAAAAVLLLVLWTLGAALARYDPWSWEIIVDLIVLPPTLRAG